MSELIKSDNEYKEWITNLSCEYKKSQIRAAVKVNEEMLRFYWMLGKGISSLSDKYGYGSGFYKIVSEDFKDIFPEVKSFSPTNLKYMRYFYEMYPDVQNRPQAVDDFTMIFRIPWGHNRTIIDKCKNDTEKALFYVQKTLENNWSRDVLLNFLDSDLYERKGKAILICKDMDKVEAQYALESTSQPLGISSYELSKLVPDEFKGSMPTIEEIEAELNE